MSNKDEFEAWHISYCGKKPNEGDYAAQLVSQHMWKAWEASRTKPCEDCKALASRIEVMRAQHMETMDAMGEALAKAKGKTPVPTIQQNPQHIGIMWTRP